MTTIERYRVRGLPRALWLVVLVLLPVVGALVWFVLGRGPVRRPLRAPDDDPAFLAGALSGRPRRAIEPPDSLALLEQELANLDGDPDDDPDR